MVFRAVSVGGVFALAGMVIGNVRRDFPLPAGLRPECRFNGVRVAFSVLPLICREMFDFDSKLRTGQKGGLRRGALFGGESREIAGFCTSGGSS